MIITKSKIAIVGCGLVGSSTAFSLVTQGVCDEILLIDINKEKALGEVLDLRDTIKYLDRNVRIRVATYEECKDVSIVVITAGAPPKPGQSRLDMLEVSTKIIPVSTLLEGEYGEEDIYAGVPCILNRSGVSDILEIHMTQEEQLKFQRSAQVLREYTLKCKDLL